MKIKSNLKCITYFKEISILPNLNEITEDQYLSIKNNPVFISKVDNDFFQVMDEGIDLQKINQNKAIKFINESIDVNFLKLELEKETRDVVKREIQNRIKDITTPEKVK
ncbi:MAG: hypothetical protein DCC88_00355 [Spirobacillus cienkowskii]|jgi:hypothetical protein|uniref:Uncharacterized protein n=1 Tax=Spirobacillus cienkowskii TaxID=495820 RepID=A0A369KUX3_9BACT|nr:MAG: hypothetical protein DCC88_00355 [Spirobacillus cienkowskii]